MPAGRSPPLRHWAHAVRTVRGTEEDEAPVLAAKVLHRAKAAGGRAEEVPVASYPQHRRAHAP